MTSHSCCSVRRSQSKLTPQLECLCTFSPVYCTVCARPLTRERRLHTHDSLLIIHYSSFIIQHHQSHSFSTSATKCHPEHRTWCTEHVFLNPATSSFPSSLTSISTHRQLESKERLATLTVRSAVSRDWLACLHTDFDRPLRSSRPRGRWEPSVTHANVLHVPWVE